MLSGLRRFPKPRSCGGVDHRMTYRDDLQALVARHNAHDAEMMRNRQARDQLRLLIDDAQRRLRLPVVDNVRPAAPCSEDWSKMEGDARVRACARCQQNVYNLSEMTREEAHALLVENEGKVCVKFYRRADGTILTTDCAVGTKRRRRRRVVALGIAASLAASVLGVVRSYHRRPELDGLATKLQALANDQYYTQAGDYLGGAPGNLADDLRNPFHGHGRAGHGGP